MSSGSTTKNVTKHDLAALSKAKQEAEIRLVNATVLYQLQKEKAAAAIPTATSAEAKEKKKKKTSKKRDAPEMVIDPVTAAPEKPKKEKKEPKEKPVNWVCEGNVLAGTECPLATKDQVFVGQTNYDKKKHNLCKACKKAFHTAKKAAAGTE